MSMRKCKFCDKEFSKTALGAHTVWCKLNPRLEANRASLSNVMTGKTYTEERKVSHSKMRRDYLEQHPDKVPYRVNHSSKESYAEKSFRLLLETHNIVGWQQEMQFGRFTLDFAFESLRLDVEIDGSTHELSNVMSKDKIRDEYMEEKGWQVLRITAKELKHDPKSCIEKLQHSLVTIVAIGSAS